MESGMEKFINALFILILAFMGVIQALQKENIHIDVRAVNKKYLLKPLNPAKCSHGMLQSLISNSRNLITDACAIEKTFYRSRMPKCDFPNRYLSNEKYTLNGNDTYRLRLNSKMVVSQPSIGLLFYETSSKHPYKSDFISLNTLYNTPVNSNLTPKYVLSWKPEMVENGKNLLLQPSVDYYDAPMNSNATSKHVLPSKPEEVEYEKDLILQPSVGYHNTTINSISASNYFLSSKPEEREYERDLLLQPSVGYLVTPINSNSAVKYILPSKPEGVEYGKNLQLSDGYDDQILSNNLPTCNITDISYFIAPLRFMGSLMHSNTPITNMFELKSSMSSPASSFSSSNDIASTATSEMPMSQSSEYSCTITEIINQEDSTNLLPSASSGRTYRSSVEISLSESGYAESSFISSSIFNDSDTSGGYNLTNTTDEYS